MAPISISPAIAIELARQNTLYLADLQLCSKVAFSPADSGSVLVLKDTLHDDVPTPAVVTFFGEVSHTGCFITPYGAYKPNRYEDDITKAKLKAQLRKISQHKYKHLLGDDWDTYLQNITSIHKLNYDEGEEVYRLSPIKDLEIGVIHNLFQKIDKQNIESGEVESEKETNDSEKNIGLEVSSCDTHGKEEAESHISAADTAPSETTPQVADEVLKLLTFEGWPVTGDWKKEMDSMKDELELQPLEAYDGVGDHARLLSPLEYEKRLPGSIVKMNVTFHSYKFGRHALSVHIENMCIVAPAITLPQSPSKKRFKKLISGSPSTQTSPTKAALGSPSSQTSPTKAALGSPSTQTSPTKRVLGSPSTQTSPPKKARLS